MSANRGGLIFWNKKKNEKPFGIQLRIDFNAMTLAHVAKTSESPSIQRMSQVWLEHNCTRINVGVAAINGVKESVLIFLGSDGNIYTDLDFEIKLPFPIGPNKTDLIQVTPAGDYIFISFEEVVIMALPVLYIVNSLQGRALVEYGNIKKDTFGEQSEIEIEAISPKGDCNLPVISNVAKSWFKYENTAVKVMLTPILANDDFPISLNIRTE